MRGVTQTTENTKRHSGSVALVAGVYLLLVAVPAGLVSEALFRRANTLHNNGHWVSQKMKLARGVMGGTAYFLSPAALAGKRLNLHPFFGSQELYYQRAVTPKSVSFRFLLGEKAYLNVLYDKTDAGAKGIRLSRDSRFPSMAFSVDGRKLFQRRTPIANPPLDPGWNRMTVRFAAGQARVTLNGQELGTGPGVASDGAGLIGFRGGTQFAAIDDVEIQTTAGETVVDAFDPGGTRPWLLAVGAVLLPNLVLLGVLVVINRNKSGRGGRYFLLKVGFAVALVVVPLGIFDIFFLVQWEREPADYLGYPAQIETTPQTVARLKNTYSAKNAGDADRIFLIGSSQLWGAGALTDADTLTQRLAARLRQSLERPYDVMNLSINGSRSPELLQHYEAEWLAWQPTMVVLSLSSNDHPHEVEPNMTRFAQLNQERGIKTLFLLEPNSVETDYGSLADKHNVVRGVATKHGIPLFNMYQYLAQNVDAGFLWWDSCHMTSGGQDLFARALSAEIVKILGP